MTHIEHTDDDTRAAGSGNGAYFRFFAMIVTAMVAMYVPTYVNSMEWAHVRWSDTRVYMTLIMGASMALIMLGFMLGQYPSGS
jgi:hypothetical protein